MMLEALFARDGQPQAFLGMVVCGAVLGMMLHAGRLWRGIVWRILWDGLTALFLAGMALCVLMICGAPLRMYAFVGLGAGLLLYMAGPGRILRRLRSVFGQWHKTLPPKEGEALHRDELI